MLDVDKRQLRKGWTQADGLCCFHTLRTAGGPAGPAGIWAAGSWKCENVLALLALAPCMRRRPAVTFLSHSVHSPTAIRACSAALPLRLYLILLLTF